ncbi:hypothetical protein ACA910_021904 [Epithemia clementina (nom. ined.)]
MTSESKTTTICLRNETREEWEIYKQNVKPYAMHKGFYWALIGKPKDLPDEEKALQQDNKVYVVASDGTLSKATVEQKVAYKSNAAARNFLTRSLQGLPTLMQEVNANSKNAAEMWDYMTKKFETRDAMLLFTQLEEELTKLNPITYEDGYKFVVEVE